MERLEWDDDEMAYVTPDGSVQVDKREMGERIQAKAQELYHCDPPALTQAEYDAVCAAALTVDA